VTFLKGGVVEMAGTRRKMDAETLKYFSCPKMQEKFRKAMGGRKLFDRVYDLNNFAHKYGEGIITSYSSEHYFSVTSLDGFVVEYSSPLREIVGPPLVCLPLPFDPQNPSRGLWGMVDWTVFSENKRVLNDGQLHLSFGNSEYIEGPPELALLKALTHQWGIEIKVEK